MQIDHDRDEIPRDTSKSPWGRLAVILALVWIVHLFYLAVDWQSVALGAFTAGVFVLWAIEYTGNRIPASWRKPPGSRRT